MSKLFHAFWVTILNFYHGTTASSAAEPPLYRGFMITLIHATLDRTLWTSDYHIAENSTWQHSTVTTDINETGVILNRNCSKQAATDPRPRPRSHWDQQCVHLMHQIQALTGYNITVTSIRHVLAGQFHHQEVHSKPKTNHIEMNHIYVLLAHYAAKAVCMRKKYANFLPSVTQHVTEVHRPQWVKDQGTWLCTYCH